MTDKPHITRAQPYDGDGWICYGCSNGNGTGFGATPVQAYADWLDPASAFKFWTQGAGMEMRIASSESWYDDGPSEAPYPGYCGRSTSFLDGD